MYNERELFEPYQGFIRGNMYKNIYDGYGEVYDLKPANEQAELLTYINICDFAMIDVGLYLDIWPEDQECIDIYNRFRQDKLEFVKKYEEKYGALSMDAEMDGWSWVKCPWPWEV